MKKNEVLNSIYIVPAIIEALKGNQEEYLHNLLKSYDINYNDFSELKNILEYHKHIVKSGFQPNYPLLRNGLNEYFFEFLNNFWETIGIINTNKHLLDYGCGDGTYSSSFISNNHLGKRTMLDRQNGLCIDFQKDPLWWETHIKKYDIVLLSEILHCKDKDWMDYLITSSHYVLKENGTLIINENIDSAMGWRLDKMSDGGKMLTESDIISLMRDKDFKLMNINTIENHKIYTYEKS